MYIQRAVESQLKKKLFQGKILILYGARQVGKTTLVKKIAGDSGLPYQYLNCDELDVVSRFAQADNAASLKQILGPQRLVVIDEAQRVKNIGLKLKLIVDNFPAIQIIATGSSSFDLASEVVEPLTGRAFEFWLFPLSFSEIIGGKSNFELQRLLESLLVFGSYPEIYMTQSFEEKSQKIKAITANYLYKDILQFSGIKNSEIVLKLMQALSLQLGNEVSYNELAGLVGINRVTVAHYIEMLEKAFVIFRLSPYSRNLRTAIGKMKKIYFLDLGIRNALINNQNPLHLRDDIGKLWENFVIAEKYKRQLGPGFQTNYYFWRTYDQQEVDLVEERGGNLFGWEIKWQAKGKRAPKAWRTAYPKARWQIIEKSNFVDFLG